MKAIAITDADGRLRVYSAVESDMMRLRADVLSADDYDTFLSPGERKALQRAQEPLFVLVALRDVSSNRVQVVEVRGYGDGEAGWWI